MDRIAVIDLGTNTFNLLIAEVRPDRQFKKLFSHRIPVMLGEGTINQNFISPAPFERGIAALKKFMELITQFKVKKVIALATSAIRSAGNKMEFVEAARKEAGVKVEIISGEREAELIFLGNAIAAKLGMENSLVMDIGGGSTEFIIGNRKGIKWIYSSFLGAARLIERFKPEDPITAQTITALKQHFEAELQPLFMALKEFPCSELVGSSGAFDSIVELIDANFESMHFSDKKIVYDIVREQFGKVRDIILASTLAERREMKGLIPMRVEMIVVSFILVDFILSRTGISKIRSTTWSLKEGAIVDYLKNL